MHYISKAPIVIGEFDPGIIHSEIEAVVSNTSPAPNGLSVGFHILESHATEHSNPTLADIAQIKWGNPSVLDDFNHFDALNYKRENIIDQQGLQNSLVKKWHPDTMDTTKLPEIITGASIYPTEFLLGRISVDQTEFDAYPGPGIAWVKNTQQNAIHDALDKGDAHIINFEPGQIVQAPRGTLHRQAIPEHATGYRFFLRYFSKD